MDAVACNMTEYENCRLCPRECGVDRSKGQTGYCGETAVCRAASFCAHFGEEPPLSSQNGSGTVFFSGCSCNCFFCQNFQISHEHSGTETSQTELEKRTLALASVGVHNINFVTPDHFWPHIRQTCLALRKKGITIPFIYNCSGYERAELIPEIAQAIEIFLSDFKFAEADLARECMGDSSYPEIALSSLCEMVDARGFLSPWDPSGNTSAENGVLVRHLVLPGELENSLRVLDILYREIGPDLPISIMSQFHPTPECFRRGSLTNRVSPGEYEQVCTYADALGFKHLLIQKQRGDDALFPDFNLKNPFKNPR